MMSGTDMHLHTIYSDGQDSPEQMIDRAAAQGYGTVAVTDHDGVGGVKAAVAYGKTVGVHVVPGVELSAEHVTALPGFTENRYFMHILGYGIDPDYRPLTDRLRSVLERRDFRNEQIIEAFARKGIVISKEELLANTPNLFIGKVSFARVLCQRGYVGSIDEAFASPEFLGSPEIRAIRKDKISAAESIGLIRGAGGKVFFAHPYQLTYPGRAADDDAVFQKKLYLMLKEFASMGMEGIECGYPTHTQDQMQFLLNVADELGMLCSRGSDDHGSGVRAVKQMGRMQAEIPAQRLEYIRKLW